MEFDKALSDLFRLQCQRPNSRTPGESITSPPCGNDTVVRRSWCADQAPSCQRHLGQDLFLQTQQRVQQAGFANPDCPAKMLMRPVNASSSGFSHPEYDWKPSIRDNRYCGRYHLLVDELHAFVVQQVYLVEHIIGSICKVSQATR